MILSIDPGINHCGVGLFNADQTLCRAWLARAQLGTESGTLARCADMARQVIRGMHPQELGEVTTFVGEWPVAYAPRRGRKRVDPNVSLMPLCGVLAAIASYVPLAGHVSYAPRAWKGTMDGDAFTNVIKRALTPTEIVAVEACLCPPGLIHNVYDGVGVGLKYLGRLERRRVISRGKK